MKLMKYPHVFMDIATGKAETTTRTGLPLSTQPLTWQHDIKSLVHRKQVDDSTVH